MDLQWLKEWHDSSSSKLRVSDFSLNNFPVDAALLQVQVITIILAGSVINKHGPTTAAAVIYTVSQKKQSKLFSSELRQISINFDNFWQKDGQDDEIM